MAYSKNKNQRRAHLTLLIVALNVLAFAVLTWGGMTEDSEYMLQHGALYAPYVFLREEYYRLFTSMFLHFGFEHLVGNMVCLLAVGWDLELSIGKWRYALIYLSSGLASNATYIYWCLYTDSMEHVSAGASGAIFGVLGAVLYLSYKYKAKSGVITSRGITFMILMMLFYGFTESGVNNVAHVAGLISGVIITAVVTIRFKTKN